MQVALLITTYNRPDALNWVLASVAKQSRLPDEVIICDDGSVPSASAVIASWSRLLPIRHVWIPDANFRAARTRNLGILKSRAEVLLFVDGDCLLPPSFVAQHLKLLQPGYLIAGGRYLLSLETTQAILNESLPSSAVFDNWKFFKWPLGPFRDLLLVKWETVRSCNLAVYREDALRIAGFDETFIGWGREDSDFVVRMLHSGVKIRSGRLAACVAHLYHPECARDQFSVNDQKFCETLNNPKHVMAASSNLYQ